MEDKMDADALQDLRRVEEKLDRLGRFVEALAEALIDSRMIDGADFRLRIDSGEERSRP